jgi:hypothetical protein
MHYFGNELGVPPHFGVVLKFGVIHGDASLFMDTEGSARPCELFFSQIADTIIVACH